MLRNSEKLTAGPGVMGAVYPPPPLGVEIIEVPRKVLFDGGVDGGYIPETCVPNIAGEGELARSGKHASSPVIMLFRCLLDRFRVGGGVRGPEVLKMYESRLYEFCERLRSSSET